MSAGTIYVRAGHPRATFLKAVAAFEKIDLAHEDTPPEKLDAAKFPLKRMPGFVKGDFVLTETSAIAQYLTYSNDQSVLPGKTQEDKAKVVQWVSYTWDDLHSAFCHLIYPTLIPMIVKSSPAELQKKADFELEYLEKTLQTKTFLVADRLSLADLAVASVLGAAASTIFDSEWRAKYPNVVRYYTTVANQPSFLAAAGGEPKLIEKRLPVVKGAEKEKKEKPAAAAGSSNKGPAAAVAGAAAGAAAAVKKAAKKVTGDDEEEDDKPAEPKAKHPLEALGKPKLVLDEWKRQYSNLDTKDALKWFEENYDPQEYSLWKATYKYPEELTQVFMSSNLIGGFHNRLEASRKYLFGSAGVYGTANDSKIQGVYLVRGGDWKPAFDVAPDYESYEFTPVDYQKDKQLVAEVWSWEGELDGKKFADGKVFK